MDIVKCNKCGQVLISGKGCLLMFSYGTKIGCQKCGNTYTFGEEEAESNYKIDEKIAGFTATFYDENK